MSSAVNVVIQMARLSDGTRRVVKVAEITGMEGDIITMQDIFLFERQGVDQEGKVLGVFRATGVRPKFADMMSAAGIHLTTDMFANRRGP